MSEGLLDDRQHLGAADQMVLVHIDAFGPLRGHVFFSSASPPAACWLCATDAMNPSKRTRSSDLRGAVRPRDRRSRLDDAHRARCFSGTDDGLGMVEPGLN